MKLYLMRHGNYEVMSPLQKESLSAQGKAEIKSMANFLKSLEISVDEIFHSGKLRAIETAELLSEGLNTNKAISFRRGLLPDDNVIDFANDLSLLAGDTLIVGHMPFMARLCSKLVTGDENKNIVNFQMGTLVCLEKHEYESWLINWLLNPLLFASHT